MHDPTIFNNARFTTIIEHRTEGLVVGRIDYAGLNKDGSVVVGWREWNGGNRTTHFFPKSWKWWVTWNVLFFERINVDDDSLDDLPWKTSENYIVLFDRL